ncbi:MAG TPA: polysaccharide export protein EpsE [Burkholderiales bacterium]|nr:polysaccharide export protein EpsE [Burkholderiales bacterium]
MKRVFFALLALFMAAPAAASEKLGVGDAVRVSVFQQPDLTTETRVSERGTIDMPLIGEVKVDGLATGSAAAKIAAQLKQGKFLKNPQVSVALITLRSRQVSVLGQVTRPGRYPLDDTSSRLADVIAAAGGLAPEGSHKVRVMREGKTETIDLFAKSHELKGGETVLVERAPVFYIYGEVTRAGAYRLEPNLTVMQAISLGGGITPRGSDRRLKLRRAGQDGKIVETDVSLRDSVKANDVIYVRESIF